MKLQNNVTSSTIVKYINAKGLATTFFRYDIPN